MSSLTSFALQANLDTGRKISALIAPDSQPQPAVKPEPPLALMSRQLTHSGLVNNGVATAAAAARQLASLAPGQLDNTVTAPVGSVLAAGQLQAALRQTQDAPSAAANPLEGVSAEVHGLSEDIRAMLQRMTALQATLHGMQQHEQLPESRVPNQPGPQQHAHQTVQQPAKSFLQASNKRLAVQTPPGQQLHSVDSMRRDAKSAAKKPVQYLRGATLPQAAQAVSSKVNQTQHSMHSMHHTSCAQQQGAEQTGKTPVQISEAAKRSQLAESASYNIYRAALEEGEAVGSEAACDHEGDGLAEMNCDDEGLFWNMPGPSSLEDMNPQGHGAREKKVLLSHTVHLPVSCDPHVVSCMSGHQSTVHMQQHQSAEKKKVTPGSQHPSANVAELLSLAISGNDAGLLPAVRYTIASLACVLLSAVYSSLLSPGKLMMSVAVDCLLLPALYWQAHHQLCIAAIHLSMHSKSSQDEIKSLST